MDQTDPLQETDREEHGSDGDVYLLQSRERGVPPPV